MVRFAQAPWKSLSLADDGWVVWNRDQTRVIARGRSFDEAKRNALAVGASSVIVSRASDRGRWSPHSSSNYSVAVFLAAAS